MPHAKNNLLIEFVTLYLLYGICQIAFLGVQAPLGLARVKNSNPKVSNHPPLFKSPVSPSPRLIGLT